MQKIGHVIRYRVYQLPTELNTQQEGPNQRAKLNILVIVVNCDCVPPYFEGFAQLKDGTLDIDTFDTFSNIRS